jgi:tetratricopeptide (TPR) repeat protein
MKRRFFFMALPGILLFCSIAIEAQSQTLKEQWDAAGALMEERKFDEALVILHSMLESEELTQQNRSAILFRAAIAYSENHDDKAAVGIWDQFLELQPEDGVGWANRGWSLYLTGDVEEAIASTIKGLECNPKMFYALANLGLYYLDLGRQDEAIATYDRAIEECEAGESVEGAIKDLDDLGKKRPALKAVITDVRERIIRAADGDDTK